MKAWFRNAFFALAAITVGMVPVLASAPSATTLASAQQTHAAQVRAA